MRREFALRRLRRDRLGNGGHISCNRMEEAMGFERWFRDAFGGTGEIFGLNDLTAGSAFNEGNKAAALRRARERGFRGA